MTQGYFFFQKSCIQKAQDLEQESYQKKNTNENKQKCLIEVSKRSRMNKEGINPEMVLEVKGTFY